MAKSKLAVVIAAAVVSTAAFAPASVIYLRNNTTSFTDPLSVVHAVTQTTFDDTFVSGQIGGPGGTVNNGTVSNFSVRTQSASLFDAGLLGIKELFTLVPATSGGQQIHIDSATLHLFANPSFPGDAGSTTSVYRMTTNWMPAAAGGNQGNVSGRYAVVNTTTNWAVGQSFSVADYTTTNGATISTWQTAGAAPTPTLNDFNVTGILSDMYSTGINDGLVIRTSSIATRSIRTSDNVANITPVLELSYHYAAIPEPAALGLVAASVALLMVRRRRSQA